MHVKIDQEGKTMKQVRILLTGSSGFLGQHILKALATTPPPESCSYHVQALYRSLAGFPEAVQMLSETASSSTVLQPGCLNFAKHDDVDHWIQRQRHPIHVCIHTAAVSSPRVCQEDPAQADAVNVPQHFFRALHQHNPHMFIIGISTDHVYDGNHAPYRETDPARPVNCYGQTKLALEQLLLELFAESSVLLRSSMMVGPEAPLMAVHGTFLHFIATRQDTDTVFFTNEKRNAVYIGDVVASILWFVSAYTTDSATRLESAGVYNLGGPVSYSRMEMAEAVFDHLGYNRQHLIPKTKEPSTSSPLDVSIDSSRLQNLMGLSFAALPDVLKVMFK